MRALLITLAILLGGAGAAGATTALLTSGLLATNDKALTHATCTLQPASSDQQM